MSKIDIYVFLAGDISNFKDSKFLYKTICACITKKSIKEKFEMLGTPWAFIQIKWWKSWMFIFNITRKMINISVHRILFPWLCINIRSLKKIWFVPADKAVDHVVAWIFRGDISNFNDLQQVLNYILYKATI